MIFFRKKKPDAEAEPEKPAPVKKAAPTHAPASKKPEPSPEKIVRSLQEIAHDRVLTAEGWRRSVEKKIPSKKK